MKEESRLTLDASTRGFREGEVEGDFGGKGSFRFAACTISAKVKVGEGVLAAAARSASCGKVAEDLAEQLLGIHVGREGVREAVRVLTPEPRLEALSASESQPIAIDWRRLGRQGLTW